MQYNILKTPIEYLKGVGPAKADLLKKELRIFTYQDLLYHYPFRYVDRSKFYTIGEVKSADIEVQIIGKITRRCNLSDPNPILSTSAGASA